MGEFRFRRWGQFGTLHYEILSPAAHPEDILRASAKTSEEVSAHELMKTLVAAALDNWSIFNPPVFPRVEIRFSLIQR